MNLFQTQYYTNIVQILNYVRNYWKFKWPSEINIILCVSIHFWIKRMIFEYRLLKYFQDGIELRTWNSRLRHLHIGWPIGWIFLCISIPVWQKMILSFVFQIGIHICSPETESLTNRKWSYTNDLISTPVAQIINRSNKFTHNSQSITLGMLHFFSELFDRIPRSSGEKMRKDQ